MATMSQIDTLIGEAVHRAMWRRRLQQIEIAPQMGMTQSGLSKKIRGQRPWSVEEVYRIAGVIGIDPSELLLIQVPEAAVENESAVENEAGGEATSGYRSVVGGDAYCPPLHAVDLLLDPFPLQIPTAS